MNTAGFRRPTTKELWAGIKDTDVFYTCCLCGHVIPQEDFRPEYVSQGFSSERLACHSDCYEHAAAVGHSLRPIGTSRFLVREDYSNEGTLFSTSNLQQPCVTSNSSSSQRLSRWGSLLTRARKILSSLQPVRVSLAIPATLLAVTTLKKRYAGLLLLALAFASECAFRICDPHAGNPQDYWNTYYFLYAAGPHISGLLTATGFFFLVHEKIRNWAILPGSYKLAKIIWLAFVSSNEQLHQFVPWGFLVMGLSASILWFMGFDYLMGLHFHKFRGAVARIVGALNAPGIPDAERLRIARDQANQLQQL